MTLIQKLHQILNLCKGFETGYSSGDKNHMLIIYEGKRYAVKIAEIENPSEDAFEDISRLKYYV